MANSWPVARGIPNDGSRLFAGMVIALRRARFAQSYSTEASAPHTPADNCGGGQLLAVGTAPFTDTCEIFFVYKVDNANNIIWGPISNGDQIAIKTNNGHWLVAKGGGLVNADRTAIGAWEKFFITM